MRRAIITVLACAFVGVPVAHAQMEPFEDRGDQFAPKEAGTVEKLRFWYGPYAVPPGNDYNRFDLNLPVRNGYVLKIEPGLKRVADMSVPTHQEAHIHHAHWLRLDPGNDHDNYTYGFTQWLWGTGDEETRADARRQTRAQRKGPVYGGETGPGEIEPVIYMIHNKTSSPLNTWMVLDVVFLHGTEAELEEKTGRDHRSPTGVIFGRTFDVLRNRAGRRHVGHRAGRQGGPDRVDLDAERDDRGRGRPPASRRRQRDAREPRLGGAAMSRARAAATTAARRCSDRSRSTVTYRSPRTTR